MLSGLFALIGRIMLALLFIVSGVMKLTDIPATASYMASVNLPTNLALPVAWFEIIGGAMIIFGIFTRLTAIAFAAFCLLTALLFHRETADPVQAAAALKNIAIAGGFLCLFAFDQKSYSFDAYRARRQREADARLVARNDHDVNDRTHNRFTDGDRTNADAIHDRDRRL
ncbi:MAG: DoxX family protein [Pseudomonadota bacterium]